MLFLKNLKLNNLIKIISSDYPGLKIKNKKILNDGWDFLALEINKNYIIRFPKAMKCELNDYGDNIKRMQVEIKVLAHLQNKISLPIPNVKLTGKKYAYFGYKKIRGVNLTKKIIWSLTKKQYKKLIFDLANFLNEIHSALTAGQAKQLGVLQEDYASYSDLIIAKIIKPKKIKDKQILNFIIKTTKEYQAMIKKKMVNVFLYNDLHGDNMAFDIKKKKLNGIFDFSDVMVGDINLDFNCLYRFGQKFLEDIIKNYSRLSDRKLDKRRIILYSWINEISDLALCINRPNSKIYKNVIKEIRGWIRKQDTYL